MIGRKGWALMLLAAAEVAAMTVWFSAAAIAPNLTAEAGLSPAAAGRLTSFVQLGFVAGALGIALTGLADRCDPRVVFAGGALLGAAANAVLLFAPPGGAFAQASRVVVGAAMAGVYPVGMTMVAGWARPGELTRPGDLGLLVGILVGALSLGSATPHLTHAFGGVDWRMTVMVTSASTAVAGVAILIFPLGPATRRAEAFRMGDALAMWRQPALRLANFGYLGHMWEIYAVWAWLVVFVEASYRRSGGMLFGIADHALAARLTTFASVGIAGAASCIIAGVVADRIGRTRLTAAALAVSGSCALLSPAVFGAAPALVFALCMVWGFSIVADSAQFSAAAAELAPPGKLGTVLTAQTAAGFVLTIITIQGVAELGEWVGWRWAFAPLALGPVFGAVSMLRLRARPEAQRLAGGRG